MREPELLRLDHDRNVARLRELGETRFRLLAFVPTIAGATVAILPQRVGPEEFAAVGLVGLVATLGIFFYELRNTAVIREVSARVLLLERGVDPDATEAPPRRSDDDSGRGPRLFGLLRPTHARGLAFVYAAALGSWVYLTAWGALGALDVPGADWIGAIVAVVAGIVVVGEGERFAAQVDT